MTAPLRTSPRAAAALAAAALAAALGAGWLRFLRAPSADPADRPPPHHGGRDYSRVIAGYLGAKSCTVPDAALIFHFLSCAPPDSRWVPTRDGCWTISAGPSSEPLVVDVLLNSELFRAKGGSYRPVLNRSGKPFFSYAYADGQGTSVGGQEHPNQFLAYLASLGVEAGRPVSDTGSEGWTVGSLVEVAKANAAPAPSARQLAWTIEALGSYVGFGVAWENKFGQKVSVDLLVDSMIAHRENDASCARTHYAHALAFACSRLESQGRAVPKPWADELDRLVGAAAASQADDGTWDADWQAGPGGPRSSTRLDPNAKSDALFVTAHMVEWLVSARRTGTWPDVDRAIDWVALESERRIKAERQPILDEALAHAVHALRLVTSRP